MAAPSDPIPPVYSAIASRPVLDGERERHRGRKPVFSLKPGRKYSYATPQPTQDQVTLAAAAQARFAADLANDAQDDPLDAVEERTDIKPDTYAQQVPPGVERKTGQTDIGSASAPSADQSAAQSEVHDARPHVDDYA